MNIRDFDSHPIACICEGVAELVIMNILLDNHLLVFEREQLIDSEFIRRLAVKDFERKYLRREYDNAIIILRIIDSRSEQFNLRKAYEHQVKEIIKVITAPEIEILIIVAMKKYESYIKSRKKPSDYCVQDLGLKNVKSRDFYEAFFSDPDLLVNTIHEYHRLHKQLPHESSLYDLLDVFTKK